MDALFKNAVITYKQTLKSIIFEIRKIIYEMYNKQSRVMSYEFYLMYKNPIDRRRLAKAHREVSIYGKTTFYSEVFNKYITLTTNY